MANEVSAWLAKLEGLTAEQLAAAGITAEDIAAAKKEHLLERDYTQGKQKVAPWLKLQEDFSQYTPEQMAQLAQWYTANETDIKRLWNNRDRLVERPAQPNPAAPAEPGQRRKWRDADAAALYDNQSLREIFADLHEDAATAGYERFKNEYQKTEIPRLDQVAGAHVQTVLDIVKFGLADAVQAARDPKHQPMDLDDLIRQAALRGQPGQRPDLARIAATLREERQAVTKPLEDDAYKRGLEEGRRTAEGPSGPLGGARPGWRPEPTDTTPKNRDELFSRVVATVEKNSGRAVPLS